MSRPVARPHVPPHHKGSAFNCPHCHAYAAQTWADRLLGQLDVKNTGYPATQTFNALNMGISVCSHCGKSALWQEGLMIYPRGQEGPEPSPDMPANVAADFNEARMIFSDSARGAAALLRLGVQKLSIHLGEKGKDLNTDIGNLVKKGLPLGTQQALDTVRVIGNEAVHPGVIDLRDEPDTARQLFTLVNLIVDQMITQPAALKAIYGKLPAAKVEAIEKRDKKGS